MKRFVGIVGIFFVCLITLSLFSCVESKRRRSKSQSKSNYSTLDCNHGVCVNENLSTELFMNYYGENFILDYEHENMETLMFITPWNRNGYDYSLQTKQNMNWISPVWFTIQTGSNNKVELNGRHDINHEWLNAMKANRIPCDAGTLVCTTWQHIVPRVSVQIAMDSEKVVKDTIALLTSLRNEMGFDGFTIESYTQNGMGIELLRELETIPNMKVIYVLPAIPIANKKLQDVVAGLSSFVDRLLVMTYDYQNYDSKLQYVNAPIHWIEDIMKGYSQVNTEVKQKLLLGISLYGWKGREAMTAGAMKDWITSNSDDMEIEWNSEAQEHLFRQKSTGAVSSFATPLFVLKRKLLASKMGIAGVGYWEYGQTFPAMKQAI